MKFKILEYEDGVFEIWVCKLFSGWEPYKNEGLFTSLPEAQSRIRILDRSDKKVINEHY